MLGAISFPSLYDVAIWLREQGFKGTLEIYDISPVTLQIGKVYQELGLLNDIPRIDFIHSDALNMQLSSAADIVVSDVLGYYLSPQRYNSLIDVVSRVLRKDGIWLTRELIEPNGAPPSDKRHARGVDSEGLSDFNKFTERLLGAKLTDEQLAEWINTQWLRIPTYSRATDKDYFSKIPEGLSLVADVKTSSPALYNNKQNRRFFETFVFKKI